MTPRQRILAALNHEPPDRTPTDGWFHPEVIESLKQHYQTDDWSVVLGQWANIGTVVTTTAVSMILTVSALEMLSGRDIDINQELRVSGMANLAAGLFGGMIGFHPLSFSSLALKLGARHRASGIIAALIAGAALFPGAQHIGLLPRMLIKGGARVRRTRFRAG